MFGLNLIPWKNRVREVDAEDYGPGTALTRFRSEVDRLFDRFFSEPFSRQGPPMAATGSTGWWPSIDVTESRNEVLVRAELPGVDPDDLDISISGDLLVLSGEKKQSREEQNGTYFYAERSFGAFRRTFRLPVAVDPDRISAEYDNGVLTVRMEKTESPEPKRIPVSSET